MDSEQSQTEIKTCRVCNVPKLLDEYYVRNRKTGCRRTECKGCFNAAKAITGAAHYQANKPRIQARHKQWFEDNREYMKAKRQRRYVRDKDKVCVQTRIYRRIRRATDNEFRLIDVLRCRCNGALQKRKTHKAARTMELLGCTSTELRTYIEARFYGGMTWDHLGIGLGTFQIDHIIPVGMFDMTKPEEQRKCFHFSNLQPLWWSDHQIKTIADNVCIRKRKKLLSNL